MPRQTRWRSTCGPGLAADIAGQRKARNAIAANSLPSSSFFINMRTSWEADMASSLTLNVRVAGPLSDHVARRVGATGDFENVSEYVRSLIRRDKEQADADAHDRLKAELQLAFAAPESAFDMLNADMVIARMRQ
jgi:antitoxin ParD1/3/4